MAVFSQIDGPQIKPAGITRFHANVRQLLRNVHRQLAFPLFSACRAQDPSKFPLFGAKRAQQKSFPAVAFRPQHPQERPRPAQRTKPHGHYHGSPWCLRGAKLGIRLEKRPRDELCERSDLLVVLAGMLPVRLQVRNPGIRRQQGHLMRGSPQRRRSMLFDQGEKIPEVGKKHGGVGWIAQPGRRRSARFRFTDSREVYPERFLKRSDVLVEIEKFSGKLVS